jgi:hypothetical protein
MCRNGFKKMLIENKIKNNGREELVIYICELHNIVNKELKKEIFSCDNAIKFWGGEPIQNKK